MTANISPVGNSQFLDVNGNPLSGGKLYTYEAGTTTPLAAYTTAEGDVPQTNPVILNSLGTLDDPLYLANGVAYKIIVKTSAGVSLGLEYDDIYGVSAANTTADEWLSFTGTFTYISSTSFSVSGDQTSIFQVSRKLKTQNTAGVAYSNIASASYSAPDTTVTVTNTFLALDSGLSAIYYGFLEPTHSSIPETTIGTSVRVGTQVEARTALGSTATGDALFTTATAATARTTLDVYSKSEVPNQNIIDNSNFAINQRGVTGTVSLAAGAYGHDRWKAGSAGCTYTFAASAGITTITISAGSLVQVVEGSNLETATYTLSQSGTAQVRIVGGSYAASPIAVSATAGTNLSLEFGTGTVKQVKLENGSLATAWEFPRPQIDLLNCQRFAVKLLAGGSQETIGMGAAVSTTVALSIVTLPTTIRATPTLLFLSGSATNLAFGSPINGTISSISSVELGADGRSLRINIAGTGFTIGTSTFRQNTGTPIILISADL